MTFDINEYLTKGNLTTFATWIGIFLYPVLVSFGIEIDQVVLTTLIYTIIVLIIAVISSANPNDLKCLGNKQTPSIESEETVLNDEYECGDDDGGC